MRKISFFLVLMVSCLTINQFDDVIKKQGIIETETGWGSIVYLNNHYLVTASHLYEEDKTARVYFEDKFDPNLKFIYKKNDITLLKTNIDFTDKPTIISKVSVNDDVYWVQTIPITSGFEKLWFHGNVATVNDSVVIVDRPFYSGASGSGVYDISGNLVAIVSRYQTYENGLSFGIAEIPRFPLFIQQLIDGGEH